MEDHRDDAATLGSQGDADRDFARAAPDVIRNDAVQADGGERERDASEHDGESRGRAVLRGQWRHLLFERLGEHDRQGSFHALDRLPHGRRHGRSVDRRANQKGRAIRGGGRLQGRHEVARLDVSSQAFGARVFGDARHLIHRPLLVVLTRCDAHADGVPPVEEPFGEGLIDHADSRSIATIVFQDFPSQ